MTDEEKRLADDYKNGASAGELAKRYGLTIPSITARLRKLGVEVRPRGQFSPLNKVKDEVIAAYQNGATLLQIAAAHGVSGPSVMKFLHKHGVEMRPAVRPLKRLVRKDY